MSSRRGPITTSDPPTAVRHFVERLQACVVAQDFESGRQLFAADVVAFGTKMDVVHGLDLLEANQWSAIWPNIEDFRFDMETLHTSGDEDAAWGVATWSSTGFDEERRPFSRPGRMTVILERRDTRWVAVHTHFSLLPGIPHRTHGSKR